MGEGYDHRRADQGGAEALGLVARSPRAACRVARKPARRLRAWPTYPSTGRGGGAQRGSRSRRRRVHQRRRAGGQAEGDEGTDRKVITGAEEDRISSTRTRSSTARQKTLAPMAVEPGSQV